MEKERMIMVTPELLYKIKPLWEENAKLHSKYSPIFLDTSWQEYESWLTVGLLTEQFRVYLVEIDGKSRGFCVGQIISRTKIFSYKIGYIAELFVQQPYRRKGWGKRMFISLKHWFKEQGVDSLEVQYFIDNHEASAFWYSMGCRPFLMRMAKELGEIHGK